MKFTTIIFLLVLAFSTYGQEINSKYVCSNNSIELTFSAANDGKFRFKTREKDESFGKTFATRQNAFNEKVYLEWQIGYDALVEDVKSGKKTTKLTNTTFIGSAGREKYPYELSEILFESIKCRLISIQDLDKLQNEISSYNNFFDGKEIVVETTSGVLFNGVPFKETALKLPTLFMPQKDGTLIETSIQKQQYASGVQPMIYFDIPFKSFSNWKDLDGKKSVKGNELKYIVNKENAEVILNLFRVFGMASVRHKFDVEQIIKTLKGLI
ncbi:MAG TPA: R.Pab1 family restriction endonuclease [Pyrinomonadaceae bacterium]|nr:R.Pab1 family restriction endonuclease [Pyrinomonadaceae bacterium]